MSERRLHLKKLLAITTVTLLEIILESTTSRKINCSVEVIR